MLTIDGKVLNMAGEPVVGAKLTLNTPSAHQTTTDSLGYYMFSINEFPTSVLALDKQAGKLEAGSVDLKIYDISGRLVFENSAYLTPGVSLELPKGTLGQLVSGRVYILSLVDKKGGTLSFKSFLTSTQISQNSLSLKSGNTDDLYSYVITVTPDSNNPSFDVTTLPVDGFSKASFSHTQNFTINEYVKMNGSIDDFYYGVNPVEIDISDLFFNDNGTTFTSSSNNVSFSTSAGKVTLTYSPGDLDSEDIVITATDALDSNLSESVSFNVKKGFSVMGHIIDAEYEKNIDDVFVRITNGDTVYSAYSNLDGDFEVVLPTSGNYDIYMDKANFLPAVNKLVVADTLTVFERNRLLPEVFTKFSEYVNEHAMDYYEDMAHDRVINQGRTANFKSIPILYLVNDDSNVAGMVLKDHIDFIVNHFQEETDKLTQGYFNNMQIKIVDKVQDVDGTKAFIYTIFSSGSSGRFHFVNEETGYMDGGGITINSGVETNYEKTMRGFMNEFISMYLTNPPEGDLIQGNTRLGDALVNNGPSSVWTPLDTMMIRTRLDELDLSDKYLNQTLNFSKLNSPTEDMLKSTGYSTIEEYFLKED